MKTGAEIAKEILAELVAEEKRKLAGPECSKEDHLANTDCRVERDMNYTVSPPRPYDRYGHCAICYRACIREDSAPMLQGWVVCHHVWCKCSTCLTNS